MIPLHAQVNSLNHPALTLARQRCTHRWPRAGQHSAAIGRRKHREIPSQSRANTFQGSVLTGDTTPFKYLKLNQTGGEAVLFPIPVRLYSRIIYPMIYSPSVWPRISLSSSSDHGPASAVRSRGQCPGPAVLRLEEGGDFLGGHSRVCPAPALWFCLCLRGDQISKIGQELSYILCVGF